MVGYLQVIQPIEPFVHFFGHMSIHKSILENIEIDVNQIEKLTLTHINYKIMKTMNYLFLFSLMAIGVSCSEPEMTNEEPIATDLQTRSSQETRYLNGLELYKSALVESLSGVQQEISKLKEAIDGGKIHLLPKLEDEQKKKFMLDDMKIGLVSLKAPRGGKFPPPIPRGCWEEPRSGCEPKINLSEFGGIQETEGLGGATVEIRNEKDEIVGKGGKVMRTENGLKVMTLDADFNGAATMYITPKSELFRNDMTLTIKVYND